MFSNQALFSNFSEAFSLALNLLHKSEYGAALYFKYRREFRRREFQRIPLDMKYLGGAMNFWYPGQRFLV